MKSHFPTDGQKVGVQLPESTNKRFYVGSLDRRGPGAGDDLIDENETLHSYGSLLNRGENLGLWTGLPKAKGSNRKEDEEHKKVTPHQVRTCNDSESESSLGCPVKLLVSFRKRPEVKLTEQTRRLHRTPRPGYN